MVLFTPRTIAVYLPGCSVAMMADSNGSVGANWLLCISPTWSLVMIPPIWVVCQSSFIPIRLVVSCNSNCGLASASGTPN